MSKIALEGNVSGSGTLTIAAPNTNSNFTLSLPTNTGTIVTQNSTPAFASTIGVGGATPSTSGAGITFPADVSASSNANTLDDYEEGTFTPSIVYSGTNTPTYFANGQAGRYVKVGKVVHYQIYFNWNENGSTGNVTVSGLPFASAATSAPVARAVVSTFSFGLTGLPTNVSIVGLVIPNSATTMSLLLNDNAGTAVSATYTDGDQDLYMSGTYETSA
jgi:hypothetical protein